MFNLSFFAKGLEFRLKIYENIDRIEDQKLTNYLPLRKTKFYTEVGCYSEYLRAMKGAYGLEEVGYASSEIVAYFNNTPISIVDAFAIQDNRNEQDKAIGNASHLTEMQMDNMLESVKNEQFYYTIQIAIETEQNVNKFFDFPKQLSETITAKGYYRYTYGKFTSIQNAKDVLKMLKTYDVDGIKIIAFDNLDRIPLNLAVEKEKKRLEESLALLR